MFKWYCLGVAVVALVVFGWMLNDMRLEVKALAAKADQHLPQILMQAQNVTGQLDRHLPRLLNQSETAATNINTHLPVILKNTEQASATITTGIPRLLVSSETAVDNLADLSDSFQQYKGLMGIVHVATQNKSLFSYGSSILSLVSGTSALIGLKKPGSDQPLTQPMAAKDWATAAARDAHFLSLVSTSKEEMLHGLGKTTKPLAYHIRIGEQPPRLLADWVKEVHPDSKDVK
jgi:hypothetical protein